MCCLLAGRSVGSLIIAEHKDSRVKQETRRRRRLFTETILNLIRCRRINLVR